MIAAAATLAAATAAGAAVTLGGVGLTNSALPLTLVVSTLVGVVPPVLVVALVVSTEVDDGVCSEVSDVRGAEVLRVGAEVVTGAGVVVAVIGRGAAEVVTEASVVRGA